MTNEIVRSSFRDNDGIRIHTYAWIPDDPIAVVQIAHGLGEHAMRYDEFARTLAEQGYAVYANDHRGHGETGREQTRGDLGLLGRPGPGGLRAAERAIVNFTEIIRSAHPGLPLVLFGHSWGSIMGQRILNEGTRLYDAVILSGSAYRMPRYMESGDLNKRHRHLGSTGYEWLSRDPNTVRAFVEDELCFAADVMKLFGPFDGMRFFGVPNEHVADVPMLIMSGSDDAIALRDSHERLASAYKNRGVSDLTLNIYDGGRHEMLNEINRDEVIADIIEWLHFRFSAREEADA